MTSDDYDKSYYDFHMNLLKAFLESIGKQPPFSLPDCHQEDIDFLAELQQLPHSGGTELLMQGQQLMCRVVAGYSHLMPLLPRDLLWFFGGDCLHFMPDEEISIFQNLAEQLYEAQTTHVEFSYEQARMKAFGLH